MMENKMKYGLKWLNWNIKVKILTSRLCIRHLDWYYLHSSWNDLSSKVCQYQLFCFKFKHFSIGTTFRMVFYFKHGLLCVTFADNNWVIFMFSFLMLPWCHAYLSIFSIETIWFVFVYRVWRRSGGKRCWK